MEDGKTLPAWPQPLMGMPHGSQVVEGIAAARAAVVDCADCEDALIVTVDVDPLKTAAAAVPEGVPGTAALGRAAAVQQVLGNDEAGEAWRALRMRVHLGYPQRCPVLLFGGAPAGLPSSVKVRALPHYSYSACHNHA